MNVRDDGEKRKRDPGNGDQVETSLDQIPDTIAAHPKTLENPGDRIALKQTEGNGIREFGSGLEMRHGPHLLWTQESLRAATIAL